MRLLPPVPDPKRKGLSTGQNGDITADAVHSALNDIFSSKLFSNSPRHQDFLRFTVTETLAGRASNLKEYVLGVEVFKRHDSFDPHVSPIVRVAASRVRAKLRAYYESEGKHDAILIDLTKGSYAPVFRRRQDVQTSASLLGWPFRLKHGWLLVVVTLILLLVSMTSPSNRPFADGGSSLPGGSGRWASTGAVEYRDFRFSPDGSRLAISVGHAGDFAVWVYQWQRDTMARLTFAAGHDHNPIWTPDGSHIVFASMRHGGRANLYWMRADGTGETVRLTNSDSIQLPFSFSPDGRWLAFRQSSPETGNDLWVLPLEEVEADHPRPGKPEPILVTPTDENAPMISPDGRWVAYESNESGTREVYVQRFPGLGRKWRITTGSGALPTWSRKRPELFYLGPDGVMVVSYQMSGDTFLASKPRLWARNSNLEWFDLSPDGNRVAVVEAPKPEQGPAHVTLLLDFPDNPVPQNSCE